LSSTLYRWLRANANQGLTHWHQTFGHSKSQFITQLTHQIDNDVIDDEYQSLLLQRQQNAKLFTACIFL
jgi:hypothetical protein